MPIYKLADGRFKVQVNAGKQWDGTYKRLTKVCETEKEAIRVEKRFEKEKEKLKKEHSGSIKLKDFIEEHWRPAMTHVRDTTWHGYNRDIKLRILPRLGSRQVGSIKRADVQAMISASPTERTARAARSTLHTIFQHAIDLGIVKENPAAGSFRYPRKVKRHFEFGTILTRFSEHRKFLESIEGSSIWAMYMVGLCFGLRKGEIFGLDWKNVDFEKRRIYIEHAYTNACGKSSLEPPKTKRGERFVPMNEYAYKGLKKLHSEKRKSDRFVVANIHGQRLEPNTARTRIDRYRKKHPELPDVTLFTCRHSFITACFRENINPATIQAWVGHEHMSTTMGYVKYLPDESAEDVNTINDAFKCE